MATSGVQWSWWGASSPVEAFKEPFGSKELAQCCFNHGPVLLLQALPWWSHCQLPHSGSLALWGVPRVLDSPQGGKEWCWSWTWWFWTSNGWWGVCQRGSWLWGPDSECKSRFFRTSKTLCLDPCGWSWPTSCRRRWTGFVGVRQLHLGATTRMASLDLCKPLHWWVARCFGHYAGKAGLCLH